MRHNMNLNLGIADVPDKDVSGTVVLNEAIFTAPSVIHSTRHEVC